MPVPISVFDVRAYGARGDGRTPSDTAPIQAAMDAAAPVNGVVYVPAGTYLIDGTLYLRASSALQLAGGATIEYTPSPAQGATALIMGAGCALRGQSAATSSVHCSGRATGIVVGNGCVVSDVTVRGDGSTGGPQYNGITAGNTTDVVVERCVIADWFAHGLNAGGTSSRWTITDNVVHDCKIDGIYSGLASNDFIITNNHLYNIGSNGIDLNGSGHIVTNNRLRHIGHGQPGTLSDFWGILLQPCGAGSFSPATDASGNVIANNRLDDVRGSAIALCGYPAQSCSDNVITGNVITRCGAGIALDAGGTMDQQRRGVINRNIVTDNVVKETQANGIYLFGHHATEMRDNLLADNICTGNRQCGIELDAGHPAAPALADTVVRDNILVDNRQGPIGLSNGPIRTTIAGNKTRADNNAHEMFETPLRLTGAPHSANKVLFIDAYDSAAEPHALYPDTDPHTLTIQPTGGHKLLIHGGRGVVNLEPAGAYQIAGQTVVGPRLPGIPTVTGSPGESYGGAEQRVVRDLVAAVNTLIARLDSTTGHGLIA